MYSSWFVSNTRKHSRTKCQNTDELVKKTTQLRLLFSTNLSIFRILVQERLFAFGIVLPVWDHVLKDYMQQLSLAEREHTYSRTEQTKFKAKVCSTTE